MQAVQPVPLHEAARERYLNYALSVITARALPDVRDGLKPVQRRILYTMYNELSLHPGGRYRKCAAVVGEVMGKFHPHGDSSIYEALVRMAQDFSLRFPLVDGQGNFGSLDGDPPAAMRYTECKLRPIAEELLSEIKKRTVEFRPTYDGQRFEPVVLPAQFPQLLVNGSEGIAVGMATKIPPHNLGEVVDAAVALIDNRGLSTADLLTHVRGPDFPTGGRLLASPQELLDLYETGQGTVRVQATWEAEKVARHDQLVITSIPYGTNKGKIIEQIGDEVATRRLPQVVDVRDESTDTVRIVLELKAGSPPEVVMAYLFKHTPLETSWSVNLTCLVPVPGSPVAAPARIGLHEILTHWLSFRFDTVRARLEFDLQELKDRIHILEGLARIFDALDEAIAIIRKSEGRHDAAERLINRFDLSEEQADAILQLRLYKLARLEMRLILDELEEKRAEATRLDAILSSKKRLWDTVRAELIEVRNLYADARRTIVGVPARKLTYDEDAYIVKEDAYVVVTRDGWFKRQSSFTEIDRIRIREGDEIGWLIKAHTRSTLTFFTTNGSAYVLRVDDVPATTGYGEPVQKRFAFDDGERVIGVMSHDARHRDEPQESLPLYAPAHGDQAGEAPRPWAIAMTASGRVLRFSVKPHEEVSTRAGRKFARVDDGDAVFAVYATDGTEQVCAASGGGRAIVFPSDEVPFLKGAGKGVTGIKLRADDAVVCFALSRATMEGPTVYTNQGREVIVRERSMGLAKRGGRGKVILQRGSMTWTRPIEIALGAPDPVEPEAEVP